MRISTVSVLVLAGVMMGATSLVVSAQSGTKAPRGGTRMKAPARKAPATAAVEHGWLTDFAKARAQAKAEKRPILADFSGSDWCGWCIRLEKEVFSQQAFKDYAKDNLILFLADFPRRKEQSAAVKAQNQTLSKKYGIRGFPTVLLLDAEGKTLAQTGYRKGGAKAYVEHLKGLVGGAK